MTISTPTLTSYEAVTYLFVDGEEYRNTWEFATKNPKAATEEEVIEHFREILAEGSDSGFGDENTWEDENEPIKTFGLTPTEFATCLVKQDSSSRGITWEITFRTRDETFGIYSGNN